MKKYVQITAGRGPVECARAVTLVAREMLKAIPTLQLTDCEPHNRENGCFMSMIFATGRQSLRPQSMSGRVRYSGGQPEIPVARGTSAATGL